MRGRRGAPALTRDRLRRLDREQEALDKVEAQQEALLKKLANNEL